MDPTAVRDRGPVLPAGDGVETLLRQAVEAAVWSPSVLNTQPWWFELGGDRIGLYADVERRLDVADPDGREMLISCGAALFSLRTAIRHFGNEPKVRLLPDPGRPSLLAELVLGGPAVESGDSGRLFREIRRRRTHRGAFRPAPTPTALLSRLRDEARQEGAIFRVVVDSRTRDALAALSEAAEHVQRLDPGLVAETARWAPAPGSRRHDGVHEFAYPREYTRTEPQFAGRDFARGHGWGTGSADPAGPLRRGATGVVVVLTTVDDTRKDWLRAGQALQRILLLASAEGDLSAAFHTQALEVPELREFIRTRFCSGDHPQMILRLGVADSELNTVRRPVAEVVAENH